MSRPRKPATIRTLEGNRSRTPIPREVEPIGRPACPADLSADEQARWHAVVRSLPDGLLTAADDQVLERMAVAWSSYREASASIKQTGTLVRGALGNAVRNPLLMVRKQAAEEMETCGQALGLSPAARTRLAAMPGPESEDPLAVLLGPEGKAWSDGQRKFDS